MVEKNWHILNISKFQESFLQCLWMLRCVEFCRLIYLRYHNKKILKRLNFQYQQYKNPKAPQSEIPMPMPTPTPKTLLSLLLLLLAILVSFIVIHQTDSQLPSNTSITLNVPSHTYDLLTEKGSLRKRGEYLRIYFDYSYREPSLFQVWAYRDGSNLVGEPDFKCKTGTGNFTCMLKNDNFRYLRVQPISIKQNLVVYQLRVKQGNDLVFDLEDDAPQQRYNTAVWQKNPRLPLVQINQLINKLTTSSSCQFQFVPESAGFNQPQAYLIHRQDTGVQKLGESILGCLQKQNQLFIGVNFTTNQVYHITPMVYHVKISIEYNKVSVSSRRKNSFKVKQQQHQLQQGNQVIRRDLTQEQQPADPKLGSGSEDYHDDSSSSNNQQNIQGGSTSTSDVNWEIWKIVVTTVCGLLALILGRLIYYCVKKHCCKDRNQNGQCQNCGNNNNNNRRGDRQDQPQDNPLQDMFNNNGNRNGTSNGTRTTAGGSSNNSTRSGSNQTFTSFGMGKF